MKVELSSDSQTVIFCGAEIGQIRDANCQRIVNEFRLKGVDIDPAVWQALLKEAKDETVCTQCGGAFVSKARANEVDMGYCVNCGHPLYKVNGKVYCQYTSECGYTGKLKLFKRKESVEDSTPVKVLLKVTSDKAVVPYADGNRLYFSVKDGSSWYWLDSQGSRNYLTGSQNRQVDKEMSGFEKPLEEGGRSR